MSTLPSSLLPANEAERLRTLRALDTLPALYEPVFGAFVALTARIFSLPISLIGVVESENVFYPANYGMSGNTRQPRAEALCSTVVLHDQVVVYQDLAWADYHAYTHQAIKTAKANEIGFYAGAPLRLPGQCNVGTLCVIDQGPRVFSASEQRLLEQLAALISHTVVVRHTCQAHGHRDEARWQRIGTLLQEDLLALTALVRYLFNRQGNPIPVPADALAQIEDRLQDLYLVLSETPH
jgi:GAF domain-containing protein